jgi:hypothetical protein
MATSEAARRRAVLLLATCSVGLIPWTIGLAVTLPRYYMVGNWALAWTGFDVVLIGCFAVTGWALWKQRQVAITTSVLLLCDAWFDLLTAHGGNDRLVSSMTALFGEIPIAILLAAIAARLLRAGAVPNRKSTLSKVDDVVVFQEHHHYRSGRPVRTVEGEPRDRAHTLSPPIHHKIN